MAGFFPFWIQFLGLAMEYQTREMIEIMPNRLGIFLKLDEKFFSNQNVPVTVCVMHDTSIDLPDRIKLLSKIGICEQKVFIELIKNVFYKCHLPGHKSSTYGIKKSNLGLSGKINDNTNKNFQLYSLALLEKQTNSKWKNKIQSSDLVLLEHGFLLEWGFDSQPFDKEMVMFLWKTWILI